MPTCKTPFAVIVKLTMDCRFEIAPQKLSTVTKLKNKTNTRWLCKE